MNYFFANAWRLLILALPLLIVGCAHTEEAVRSPTPRPPAFLIGPMSLLLTNAGEGFSARVKLEVQPAPPDAELLSGQLLSRESKLLYLPDFKGSSKARGKVGAIWFIWDTAEERGIVLSEALQAHAPFTANVRPTNVVTAPEKGAAQKIEGHPCQLQEALVQMSDGSAGFFHVLRALDLKGIPARISSMTNTPPTTLTLSRIRVEPLPANLFSPPDGFTKYTSPEGMMDELALRQRNLKGRRTEDLSPPDPSLYRRPR